MKKYFKKFAKILGYAFVYILISLGTAVGVIFLSPMGGGDGGDELYIAPQLTQVYQNFTTVKALKVDLDLEVETPTDEFTILLDAQIDLNGGIENMGIDGTITVYIDNEPLIIEIRYTQGTIYVDVLNGKYMIETDNVIESLNQILSILNVELPDLGMSIGSLDLDSILAMLSDLTETKGENNITLSINVPVIGSLNLVCDLNYSIRELNLPKTEISEGTSIAVASKFNYPSSVVVEAPTQEYINATHLFTVIGSTLDYLNQEEIGFDIDAAYDGYTFAGNFSANIKDFNSKFTMNLLGLPLNLIAIDNIVYFEYGNINFEFALSDANLLSDLIYQQFGINLPINDIISILTSLKEGNLFDIIPSLNLGNNTKHKTSLNDIDLSIIQDFVKSGDIYTLSVRDIGEIRFGIKENKLSSLGFTGFGANANLTMTSAKPINLASDNYINLKSVLPTINAMISTFKQNSYTGNALISSNGEIIGSANFAFNKTALAAHIEVSVYGQTINLDFVDELVYLQVKGAGIYLSVEDIDNLTDFLKQNFNISMGEFDLDDFIRQATEILDPSVNPSFIKSLTQTENSLVITLFNDLIIEIGHKDTISNLNINMGNIFASVNLDTSVEEVTLPEIDKTNYQSLTTVLNAISATKKYIENKKFYLSFELDYDKYFVNGTCNYDETGISCYAIADIDGMKVVIRYLNDTIYLDINELKISFALSDIDTVSSFVYEKFGININQMIEDIKQKLQNSQPNDFDLQQFITDLNIILDSSSLTLSTTDFNISLNFNDMLTGISLKSGGLNLNANIESSPSIVEVTEEYFNLTEILPFIDIVMNYVSAKQFDITANAQVYDKKELTHDAIVSLQADLSKGLQFYGKAMLTGKTPIDIEASMYNDYFYFNYNGLLIKISSKDVNELLVLVLNMLGIDPSFLPSLEDVANGMDLDISNISSLTAGAMPSLSNPIDIIGLFKSIKISGNTLEVVLDGSKISTNERAENMPIKLVTDGNKLISLEIKNLYTGVSNNEHFDLHIDFNQFTKVSEPDTSKNYIDISGSNEVIKAALNMIDYRDFEIAGNFDIDMSIPVLSDMHMSMPVSFKVKIVNGKPEVFVVIDKIPVAHPLVYNLNNDTNWGYSQVNTLNIATMKSSGETRRLSIYYKDEQVYFYRHELNTKGTATYEKKLKAPLETVMSDILYYVQWGTGFNDTIIDTIRKSLENEHDINLGNIIRSFDFDSQNGICTIVLNMTEISGDKNMGDMTLTLGLTDHSTTINDEIISKKIIGKIGFKMNMPFTDSLQLNLQTVQPLELVNLGSIIDFTQFYNFINNYEYEDNIEWEAYNGNWVKAKEREFVVTFVTNQDDLIEAEIKGTQGTAFNLPSYGTKEFITDTDYDLVKFIGWYKSPTFEEGTEFTEGIIPRNSITLYAKWESLESLRTVNYYVDGVLQYTQYSQIGTKLDDSWIAKTITVKEGDKLLTKEFAGWVDDDGFTITFVPEDSVDLFAVYRTLDDLTLTLYTLTFNTGVGPTLDAKREYNSYSVREYLDGYNTSDVIINKDGVTTTYAFAGWYTDSEFTKEFDGVMPNTDATIYAKWTVTNVTYERAINIYDNGKIIYADRYVVGDEISLPDNIKVDENTLWYLDGDYTTFASLPDIMPNEDINLHIRNKYTITYNYFTKELIDGYTDRFENVPHTNSISIYQGETFLLPTQGNYQFIDYYKANNELDYRINYNFLGYFSNGNLLNEQIAPNRDILIESRLEEVKTKWCKVTFDLRWFTPNFVFAGGGAQSQPAAPMEAEFHLEGTTLDLTQSKYQPTCKGVYSLVEKNKTYKATSWGTEAWADKTKGGSGFTSITITDDTTLYACWERQ